MSDPNGSPNLSATISAWWTDAKTVAPNNKAAGSCQYHMPFVAPGISRAARHRIAPSGASHVQTGMCAWAA